MLAISNCQLTRKIKAPHSSKQADWVFAIGLGVIIVNFISVFSTSVYFE